MASPHVFTWVVKDVVGQVHLSGVGMNTYLDDWLIPSQSLQACESYVLLGLNMIL